MPDALSRALADEVAKRLASGRWDVIAITGRGGVPSEVQRWCREMFGTTAPVLVVLEEAVNEKTSARGGTTGDQQDARTASEPEVG